ncbi:GDSL esterase/lipase [Cardamine amara subsp. amara]|uniref:GDSL esterase/lipase n=1 Tax=Cardamine amara subsp. amara TaxID=228776 RepID=A0ABD1AZL2_CARAN
MESYLRKWCLVSVWVLLLGLGFKVKAEPQVPCYFIFGDSLVDNGNNNRLFSLARADYFPYGIDFGGPTGRFCNGKTTVDVIAELLGFDNNIPAYSTASGEQILQGVNYASAAAGIRDETGQQLGQRITFSGQVQNHQNIVSQIGEILGYGATDYLKSCIYSVGMGSNDYLNNYFMPQSYSTSAQFSAEEYANDLITRYRDQLNVLYSIGARKFALVGVGAIGCSPNALATHSPDGITCVESFNSPIRIFNDRLKFMVQQFNNDQSDAKFIYINAYDLFQELIANPSPYGFSVTNTACCGVGRNRGQLTCLPFVGFPCANRDEYLFWDAFHPTEAANKLIAQRSYTSQSPSDVYPMDISQLAALIV